MKNTVCLALVGLASAAAAQTGGLAIVPGVSTIDTTSIATFTLAVYAYADFGTHVFGGAFNLINTGDAGMITDMSFAVEPWAAFGANDFGSPGNGNHDGIRFGQFFIPGMTPPLNSSELVDGQLLVGVFTITLALHTSGVIDWSTIDNPGSPSLVEIYDAGSGQITALTGSHGTAQVNVFPAPSGMGLLGICGLVAVRRRR